MSDEQQKQHAELTTRTSLRALAAEHDKDETARSPTSKKTEIIPEASEPTSADVNCERHDGGDSEETPKSSNTRSEDETTERDGGVKKSEGEKDFRLDVREKKTMGDDMSHEEMRSRRVCLLAVCLLHVPPFWLVTVSLSTCVAQGAAAGWRIL